MVALVFHRKQLREQSSFEIPLLEAYLSRGIKTVGLVDLKFEDSSSEDNSVNQLIAKSMLESLGAL